MEEETAIVAAADADSGSYMDWPAVIAGAVMASAISLVLITFGSAIGLSLTSPFDNTGMSAVGLAIALGLWLVWVQVSSFMAGGYVTGRMRRRLHDATEHESDVRDGIHGLVVWGVGVLLGASILALTAGGAASTAATAVGGAAQAAVEKMADAAQGVNPLSRAVDTAFRTTRPDASTSVDARNEVMAIVARGIAQGDIPEADRTYLAQVIAARTDVPPDEAKARVDTMVTSAQQAAEEAKQQAKRAKRFAVIAAFVTAASLAISAAAAFWAAGMGGRHRDEGTVIPRWFDRMP
ncbi:hypothetical protein QV13_04530 [Mesorhizobium hungaricum]|uniref:Mll5186 protein n=2 Tax=Hyphomicrobiales TaxID=356 RepID=A0A1C2E7D9_9HYPH|nr:hypothetical protein QV13_04530 [Mesorhizobium hungaricum]